MRRVDCLSWLALFVVGMCASVSGQAASQATGRAKPSIAFLFRHAWRIEKAPSQPVQGSIYIFLPNGTLLETSCGEPYRIALWSCDSEEPLTLRITEDQRVVATWKISPVTTAELHVQKKLVRSAEMEDVTLRAVKGEFVCPDLPK